jgi:WD40 repeat protein
MGKADRIQGPAIQRLARLSRLVAVSGCSGPSAVSRIASARSWSGAPPNYRLRRRHGAGVGRGGARGITSLRGHAGWVTTAAFSPDGARIVTASDDHTARVWDAATGQEGTSLPGHAGSVTSAAFPSGRVPPPSTTTRRGCEAAAFGSTKKNALDWPMARFRFVAVDFGVRSAYFV